ncbi:hypothetical protein OAG60_02345, partial [bacterium]|nr:hypothetical protein [bacterium]
ADTTNVKAISAATTINAGADADTINVGSKAPDVNGNVNAISASLTVNGEDGSDTVNVDDTSDTSGNTGNLTGTALTGLGMSAGITYGTVEALNISLGSGDDTVTVASTHANNTVLNTLGGGDTVNVQTVAGVTVVNTGADADTINVGSKAPDVNGNVNAISASLTVNGEAGSDTMNVDDTSDTSGNTGNLTATALTGLGMSAGITYGTLEDLNISLGSGDDTFTVASTHANNTVLNTQGGGDTVHIQTVAGVFLVNTGTGPDTANVRTIDAKTTINTGDDDDTINVGNKAPASSSELKGISKELVINGQLGDDTLNIDDRGNTDPATGQIKTRSPTEVTGFEMAGLIRHETVEAVNLTAGDAGTTLLIDGTAAYSVTDVWAGDGPDVINVRNTGGAVNLHLQSGDDFVNVGSEAPGIDGTLNQIGDLITVYGGTGLDVLNLDDTSEGQADSGALTNAKISGFGMGGGVAYTELESVEVSLGQGADSVAVTGAMVGSGTPAVSVLNTGGGSDKVTIDLAVNVDGVFALNAESGEDEIDASNSTAPLIIFGGADADTILSGMGPDLLIGDRGVVDYRDENDKLIRRLGIGLAERTVYDSSKTESKLDVPSQQTASDSFAMTTIGIRDLEVGGNDTISGGDGPDLILGGKGDDDLSGGNDGSQDIILGDSGDLIFDPQGRPIRITSTGDQNGGADTIDAGNGKNYVIGGDAGDTIVASSGQDLVLGDNGSLIWDTSVDPPVLTQIRSTQPEFGGDDNIQAGDNADVILAGSGSDAVNAGTDEQHDIAIGDNGYLLLDLQGHVVEVVSTGSQYGGIDTIETGGGEDYVIAGDAGDEIDSAAGRDLVLGDHGTLVWDTSVDPPVLSEIRSTEPELGGDDVIEGGDDTDVILAGTGADVVDAGGDNSSDFAVGDHGYAFFDDQGRLIEIGTAFHQFGGADDLTAADGRDYLIGGVDSDELTANGGEDVILGDTAQLIWSQEYDPPILVQLTSPSEDTAHGGDDTIDAGEGNDLAFGGTGSDILYGRSGDDVLSNYQANFTLPLPAMPSFSGWGNQQQQHVWDQPLSLFATENFAPLNAGGDSSLGTGELVPSDNQIFGGGGDDFYLIVPGGQDTIDEGISADDQMQSSAPMAGASESSTSPDLSDTFLLHSWPSAAHTIYLDFDGHVTEGTTWNSEISSIVSPAFDPDGDGASFSDRELSSIQAIWKRVSEDFSPFEINVTTEDPGVAALAKSGNDDDEWGVRVVITEDWIECGCGGVAYLESFNDTRDEPVFVFNQSELGVSAAASHEVGHALGLSHDGTSSSTNAGSDDSANSHDDHEHIICSVPLENANSTTEYYGGHGTGEVSWGPIMGSGYYANITTWDTGEYYQSTNQEDDWQIITTQNGFGYREDDHGGMRVSASALEVGGTNSSNSGRVDLRGFGVISQGTDEDWFEFETGAGTIDLSINSYVQETFVSTGDDYKHSIEFTPVADQGSNLDILATIYDENLNIIASSNPELGLSAEFSALNLSAGRYYLVVQGVGYGDWTASTPTGFDKSISRGQYLISGTTVVPVAQESSYDTVSFQTSDRAITFDPDQLDVAQYLVDPVDRNAGSDPVTVTLVRTDLIPERSAYENVIGTAYKDVVYTDTLPVVRTFKGGNPTTGAPETSHGDELRVRTYGNQVTDNGQVLSVSGVGDLMHYEFETIEWMDQAPQIHDDGDFTFNYQGAAFRDDDQGYGGDSLRTYRRKEGRGQWLLGGLSPGKYNIAVTAPEGSSLNGHTRYQILNSSGDVLLSDEQVLENHDFTYGDVEWRDLSTPVEIVDHVMVAAVEAASDTLVSYIDALSIERMRYDAPEIRVTETSDDQNLNVYSGVSEIDFGIAPFGESIAREFVIKNLGDEYLVVSLNDTPTDLPYRRDPETGALLDRLGQLSVPEGYQVEFVGGERVAPGDSTTMRVTLLASEPGHYDGTLAFETNDVDESIFRIDLRGEADRSKEDVIYADNGSRREIPDYFSVTQGRVSTGTNRNAFGGHEARLSSRSTNQVTWNWDDLAPGVYRIATTWYGNPRSAAEDAPFEVTTTASASCEIPGSCGVQLKVVDQRVRPGDVDESFYEADANWIELFDRVTVGHDGDLAVTLTSTSKGWVYADAIRLEPLDSSELAPASELRLIDVSSLDAGNSLLASELDPFFGELDFGQVQMLVPVDRVIQVHNDGLADLALLDVPTVSAGFRLFDPTSGYPQTIGPGESLELTLRFDALILGAASGQLTFKTDNSQYPEVSIDLQGDVRDEWKLDNGDRYGVHPDGYTQTGKITKRSSLLAHEGTYGLTNGRQTGATANWTIDNLETGWYAVYSTWFTSRSNSTTAQYDISNGDAPVRTLVDQSQSPNDLHGNPTAWELLTNT